QFLHFAHTANILDAVFGRESQVRIQTVANVVSVQHVSLHTAREEFSLNCLGDCRLPRARQSSEPNDRAAMAGSRRSRSCCDLSFDPKNIFALRNRAIGIDAAKNCPASANLSVINNHKASEGGDPIVI